MDRVRTIPRVKRVLILDQERKMRIARGVMLKPDYTLYNEYIKDVKTNVEYVFIFCKTGLEKNWLRSRILAVWKERFPSLVWDCVKILTPIIPHNPDISWVDSLLRCAAMERRVEDSFLPIETISQLSDWLSVCSVDFPSWNSVFHAQHADHDHQPVPKLSKRRLNSDEYIPKKKRRKT